MWCRPTRRILKDLIKFGLTKIQIAAYYDGTLAEISASMIHLGVHMKPKPDNRMTLAGNPLGSVGKPIEEIISPNKTYKMRICLNCDRQFYSSSAGNRICDICHRDGSRKGVSRQMEGV